MTEAIARIPGDRSHLQRLINQWAREVEGVSVSFGRLQRLVGVSVVAAMLDGLRDEGGVEQLAFKGGAALELRFGLTARASGDVDAAFRGALDDAFERISEALRRPWHGFTGTIGDPEENRRPGVEPPPRRATIKLAYKARPVVSIPFELSGAEGRSLDQLEWLRPAVSLAPVRLPELPEIPFLPVRYQIAQKLHACTEEPTDEYSNDRVRDVRDVLLIRDLAVDPADHVSIREACEEIFAGRAKHSWPPTVVARVGWALLWANLMESEGFDLPLDAAIADINEFIAAIAAASPAG